MADKKRVASVAKVVRWLLAAAVGCAFLLLLLDSASLRDSEAEQGEQAALAELAEVAQAPVAPVHNALRGDGAAARPVPPSPWLSAAESAKSPPLQDRVTTVPPANAVRVDVPPVSRLQFSGACPMQVKSLAHWKSPPDSDVKLIKALVSTAPYTSCEQRHGALIFTLNLKIARKLKGNAYEMAFPSNIVADEVDGGWRVKRSTLQLYSTSMKPLGPAHSQHDHIERHGNGAYSHWRPAISSGKSSTYLRFSTPRNVPLEKLDGLRAVIFPMVPSMGWIEFTEGKKQKHQEVFRELYLQTFPAVGVVPHLVERASEVHPGTWYFWRIGGNHEFEQPLRPGEIYEKVLPHKIADYYEDFQRRGGLLFPPPSSYVYYQNKVALAELFQRTGVRTPATWVFRNLPEALEARDRVHFPVVVKDPYGFSSNGIRQAKDWDEFVLTIRSFFDGVAPGIEAIVQAKVVALREARVSYIDGRPFHGYWRIRESLDSVSAASNRGGYQSFDFPLREITPVVQRFAKATGVPVGGVDFIWKEAAPDVRSEPFTLEVSPTSDLNPANPPGWKKTYKDFKKTPGYRPAYLAVRRQWTDLMALAVIDRYRQSRPDLFVDIDNVVALSAARVLRCKGTRRSYLASEVSKDEPVSDAVEAIRELRQSFFIRFLTARGQYEDPFFVTQNWLAKHGFEYDELLVVMNAEDKVAHLTSESLLVDDFTVGHEEKVPRENTKFRDQLRLAGLPFIVFPFGGKWADILPQLREEASRWLHSKKASGE